VTSEPPIDEEVAGSHLGEVPLEEAHRRAADRDGRLLGETTEDATPEDAAHWVGVYGELVRFKHDLLDVLRSRRRELSVDANVEGGVDEVIISAQLARYERRRDEWQAAIRDLTTAPPAVPLVLESSPRTIGHVRIDPRHRTVVNDGKRHSLTPTEWKLLRVFLDRPGEVLSRTELAELAWGGGYRNRASEVEVYISRVRRKLESPSAAPLLQTVRGSGYRLVVPATPVDPGRGRAAPRDSSDESVAG
jgi:DNA-binding winged helix-turn-helix (wHTH) protein